MAKITYVYQPRDGQPDPPDPAESKPASDAAYAQRQGYQIHPDQDACKRFYADQQAAAKAAIEAPATDDGAAPGADDQPADADGGEPTGVTSTANSAAPGEFMCTAAGCEKPGPFKSQAALRGHVNSKHSE